MNTPGEHGGDWTQQPPENTCEYQQPAVAACCCPRIPAGCSCWHPHSEPQPQVLSTKARPKRAQSASEFRYMQKPARWPSCRPPPKIVFMCVGGEGSKQRSNVRVASSHPLPRLALCPPPAGVAHLVQAAWRPLPRSSYVPAVVARAADSRRCHRAHGRDLAATTTVLKTPSVRPPTGAQVPPPLRGRLRRMSRRRPCCSHRRPWWRRPLRPRPA
eukprot:353447-Chlamydomonas_euryale.AAC.8